MLFVVFDACLCPLIKLLPCLLDGTAPRYKTRDAYLRRQTAMRRGLKTGASMSDKAVSLDEISV